MAMKVIVAQTSYIVAFEALFDYLTVLDEEHQLDFVVLYAH